MIIYFMQKWADGSPTNFKEKILFSFIPHREYIDTITLCDKNVFIDSKNINPKLHTMRESFRVKKGMMLDLAYWSGKPYNSSPDRFVVQTPCVSTQIVDVMHDRESGHKYCDGKYSVCVAVDGIYLRRPQIEKLANNDGFASGDKFFEHFNKSAEYNLIHWTDLRY